MVLCFQAETITPLVIAGADNKTPDVLAEGLRPSSLRGAMRWWFRALMGGIVGADKHYQMLRDLEGKIFGATEQGSSIRLRTYLDKAAKDAAYLCMNDRRSKKSGALKDYDKIQKSSIAPNGQFLIQLDGRNSGEITLALCSLWLTAMLGGLGNRSRRGFGSLAVAPADKQTRQVAQELSLEFSYLDTPLKEIQGTLETQLKRIHGYFTHSAPTPISSPSPARFPVLSKTQAKLWLIKPQGRFWGNWEEAMNDLREDIYRAYKTGQGLREIGSANPRLASPLLIQIKRAVRDKYFGVLLAFDEQFNEQKYLGTNWSGFINFLNRLTGYEYREVTLP